MIISSIVLILHRRQLDVFRIGDVEAATLGMSVARSRLVIVVTATLGTAAVVSVSGLIGFVGLVIPHVIRLVAGASYRRLLPLSLMFGATFLILADVPGRMLDQPGRDADRRGHGVHRRAVLHLPAAHQAGRRVSSHRVRRRRSVSLRQRERRARSRSPTGSSRGSGSA